MKSKVIHFTGLIFILLLTYMDVNGQVMRLQMNVESEVYTEQLQELFFGNILPMSGRVEIPLGDPDMGVYRITGSANLKIEVVTFTPSTLLHINPELSEFVVPLELGFAYANRQENNVDHAVLFQNEYATYPISVLFTEDLIDPSLPVPLVNSYLYVFGSIEVGDIPSGIYEGEVLISIEYQ